MSNIEVFSKAEKSLKEQLSVSEKRQQRPMNNILEQLLSNDKPLTSEKVVDEAAIAADLKVVENAHEVSLALILNVMSNEAKKVSTKLLDLGEKKLD